MLTWLRGNPLTARLLIKLALVLPLGLATGLLLAWVCDAVRGDAEHGGAGGGADRAGGGYAAGKRVAVRLGIPEPDG